MPTVRALPMIQLMPAAGSRCAPAATATVVDVPERTSGRAPSPGTPHRPSRDRTTHGPRTQIRLGAGAHTPHPATRRPGLPSVHWRQS